MNKSGALDIIVSEKLQSNVSVHHFLLISDIRNVKQSLSCKRCQLHISIACIQPGYDCWSWLYWAYYYSCVPTCCWLDGSLCRLKIILLRWCMTPCSAQSNAHMLNTKYQKTPSSYTPVEKRDVLCYRVVRAYARWFPFNISKIILCILTKFRTLKHQGKTKTTF